MPPFDPAKFQGMSMDAVLDIAARAQSRGRDGLEEARSIYKLCLDQKIGIYHKGVLYQNLWGVERMLGLHPLYLSQAGQDRFIHQTFFPDKKDGVFVEIGGYNGWQGSNCYFFEKVRNWTGLIVEASPAFAAQIPETRTAEVVQAAISDRDGTAEFLEITSGYTQMGGLTGHYDKKAATAVRGAADHAERRVEVPTWRLDTLLDKRGIDHVDYCSIDVEGAERAVLSAVDLSAHDISVLSVENNSHDEAGSVRDILEPAGYRLETVLGSDEIWAKADMAATADAGRQKP